MNLQQALTVKRMAIGAVLFFLWLLYILWVEIKAVQQGGNSTISEIIWRLWADQPWVLLLVLLIFSFVGGFFLGHFVGQSRELYKALAA
jgi:hypothetical protein